MVGSISAALSLVGAVLTGALATWSTQRTKRYESLLAAQQRALTKAEQAEAILRRYREPLLSATHNLQSRLYNIVNNGYLAAYLRCGDPEQERYARNYTVYVLAEYLCWTEIIRRDLRFLDLGSEARNRRLVELLEAAHHTLSREEYPRPLRLFRGEQRAIGELMLAPVTDAGSGAGSGSGPGAGSGSGSGSGSDVGAGSDSAQRESMGYVQFCTRLDDDPRFSRWFHRLREDLDKVATADRPDQLRLITLQNNLIDLVEFLDPDGLRLPMRYRSRLLTG
jgi:hypothetical protein